MKMSKRRKLAALTELRDIVKKYKLELVPSGDGERIYIEFGDGTNATLTYPLFSADQVGELDAIISQYVTAIKTDRRVR